MMSLLDALRKGIHFMFLSLGISSPVKQPGSTPKSADKPRSGKP
jgi:hypothetical protein